MKLKARVVARGNEQLEGIDFFNTFGPMVKWSTIQTVLSLAATKRLKIRHLDVKTAFLDSKLDEDVYMYMPDGFEVSQENKVCKLLKALYDLRQAPKAWYEKIDTYLPQHGVKKSTTDSSM